jgi:mono/diheme cytochrome c family protein
MKRALIACLSVAGLLQGAQAAGPAGGKKEIDRGRYLIEVAGCNDCHTPNYGPKNGKVDEKLWLTGDALGWSGAWGTTYATNLRLFMQQLSREQWIAHAKTMEPRPPMPWFNVRAMTERDLAAIHAYVRHLGAAGAPAPAYVPPGQKPQGPVVRFPE